MTDFSLWRLLAFASSILPGLLVSAILLRLGARRFPLRLLGLGVISGAFIAIIPATLNIFSHALPAYISPFPLALVTAFGFAGTLEESAKLIAAYFIVRPYFQRRTNIDLVLGTAAVALGFAMIENPSYVLRSEDGWRWVALSRAITAVPMHVLVGFTLGLGLAKAETARGWRRGLNLFSGLALAVLLHGLYDLPLFLAERTPLYPNEVNIIAAFLRLYSWMLLSLVFLGAISLICLCAIIAVRYCLQHDRLDDASAPLFSTGPRWFARMVFSPWTGWIGASVFLLIALYGTTTTLNAVVVGAMPLMLAQTLGTAAIFITLGWMISLAPGEPRARIFARVTSGASALRRRPKRMIAAAFLVALALAGSVYGLMIVRKKAIAGVLVASGDAWRAFTEIPAALKNYDTALTYEPDSVSALAERASTFHTLQRYDAALRDFDRVVALDPKNYQSYAVRGLIYYALHDNAKALENLNQALALRPDEADVLVARANIYIEIGEEEAGLRDADRAIVLKPKAPQPHNLRASYFIDRNMLDKALSELNISLTLAPNDVTALFMRGRLQFGKKDFAAAIPDLQQAVEKKAGAYAMLWLFLARARAGQEALPTRQELAIFGSTTPRAAWPFPLIEFYLGLKPAKSVYDALATEGPDQKCEADFYVGEYIILQKLETAATTLLQRAARECPKSFIESRGAINELTGRADLPGQNPSRRVAPISPGEQGQLLPDLDNPAPPNAVWSLSPAEADGNFAGLTAEKQTPDAKILLSFRPAPKSLAGHVANYIVSLEILPNPGVAQPLITVAGPPKIIGGPDSGSLRMTSLPRLARAGLLLGTLTRQQLGDALKALGEATKISWPLLADGETISVDFDISSRQGSPSRQDSPSKQGEASAQDVIREARTLVQKPVFGFPRP